MNKPDPSYRTIEVKALTRVEGEGALRVKLDGREVTEVQLNIYEPPRFFESFLRGRHLTEVPDIVARICGICPVAYQMSSVHALEKALGIAVDPQIEELRRLLYCGEWIESHALHIHLLHAPDFLGFDSGISMASEYRTEVERGLELKRVGNELLEILGGRAVHPINVRVGGFHRAPDPEQLQALLPDLESCLAAAQDTARWVATLDFPESTIQVPFVSVKHAEEYPMNLGDVAASNGLSIPVEAYERHFEERHVAHSTALHSVMLPSESAYFVGPLARFNLAFDELPPTAKALASEIGLAPPVTNNFQSIVVRAIEVVCAFEEAIRIASEYDRPLERAHVELPAQAGRGCHATEAPRGLLYHSYEVDADGAVVSAKIVPPTSQNQLQIERELREFLPSVLDLAQEEATLRCEQLIRNYDPCISCATHFLRLIVDEAPPPK